MKNMSEQRKIPKASFFVGKPKHATRHLLIANRVRDVIDDHGDLKRDQNKAKYVKREMLPPLTTAYRQGRDVREVIKIQAQLKREIADCELGEIERQRLLEEVIGKCEALKRMFRDSEVAYAQLAEELNSHQEVMEAAAKERKLHKIAMKRYLKAGESLMELWEIMQDVIVENKCYYDFMEQVSGGSGIQAIGNLIDRFENNILTKNTLCQRLNEALERAETVKTNLIKKKEEWEHELSFELEKLQTIHRETAAAKTVNAKCEKALNNVNIDSVAHTMELNGILKSAEQMIETLIQRKVIKKSYRTKTLAQQFEAIREDYVKRKAIVREYEKAKEIMQRRKSHRLTLYEEFSQRNLVSIDHSKRLDDLYEKKKMKTIKKKHGMYLKWQKRMDAVAEEHKEEEVYDPLADKANILKLNKRMRFSSIPEEEDWDDSDDDLEGIDLTKFSDGNEFDSSLSDSPSHQDRVSFMSTSTEFATAPRNRSEAISRGTVMGSIFSGSSGGSSPSISVWVSNHSFMKQKRVTSQTSWGGV